MSDKVFGQRDFDVYEGWSADECKRLSQAMDAHGVKDLLAIAAYVRTKSVAQIYDVVRMK